MNFRPRVIIPILAAIILASVVLGYAWWQLSTTQEQLQERVRREAQEQMLSGSGTDATRGDEPIDSGDVVLLHLRQGDILALQGEWAAAEKEYQASVNAGGGIPALRKLIQAQMQRREIPKVKEAIREMRRLGARDEDLLLVEVLVALRTGELVQAQDALALAQDSPQKHYGSALLAIIQGKHDAAKTALQSVINGWDPALRAYGRTLQGAYDEFALFPESKTIHLTTLLARALAQVQECELALPLLSDVVREQDDYRDAWTVQGYCELTTERTTDALASFQKAYAIDPEKPEIQYFIGRTYMAMQQWSNASTFLQYALVNGFEPKKEVRRRLADAALQSQDLPLALEQYRGLMTEPDAAVAVFEKAITLAIQLEKKEDAYQYAQSAANKWPDSGKAQELLGWSALETGRKDEARSALEKALKLDPTLTLAREKLNSIR